MWSIMAPNNSDSMLPRFKSIIIITIYNCPLFIINCHAKLLARDSQVIYILTLGLVS